MKKLGLIITVVLMVCLLSACGHSPTKEINEAIQEKDTNKALELIESASLEDLDRPSHNGIEQFFVQIFDTMDSTDYPILEATYRGNYEVTKALVDKGVNVNVLDIDNQTPLIYILYSYSEDKYKAANYLIDNGADITIVDDFNKTALDYAEEKDVLLLEKYPELEQERIEFIERLKQL